MAPIILAYWDIRGVWNSKILIFAVQALAQPIRLLLEHVKADWEDKYYVCGPAPDYDKSCWFNEKANLGLQFPNLPYLIDGDLKLVQSTAILRYLARKYKFTGKTEEELIRVDLIENEISDFRSAFTGLCYNPEFEMLKSGYLASLPVKLKKLSDFLGDRKFLAGDNVTYVDFMVYEMLDQNKLLEPTCLDRFENLRNFVSNVENLENVKSYLSSDRVIKTRLNNRRAKFGAGP